MGDLLSKKYLEGGEIAQIRFVIRLSTLPELYQRLKQDSER